MSPPTEKTETAEDEYVWVYHLGKVEKSIESILLNGDSSDRKRYHEFHASLQEHIESNFTRGKPSCKVYIFGHVWTLDFQKMTRSRENCTAMGIKRFKRSMLKKSNVCGVSGVNYAPVEGYRQSDDLCSVCLYKPTLPTRISTCGHEFCFMCLKSTFTMGMECPTCRARIPASLFESPIRTDMDMHIECPQEYINDISATYKPAKGEKAALSGPPRRSQRTTRLRYYWIYESNSYGWYRYDPKSEKYIEESYLQGKNQCTLFICGYKMTINIRNKTQTRTTDGLPSSRRIQRIKASDLDKYKVKGIAGVRGYVRPIK